MLGLLESFEIVVLNHKEMLTNMHLNGVNIRTLGDMCKRSHNPLVKKYLISEMVARSCSQLLHQELQHALFGFNLEATSKNNFQ